jgi:outer membrane protein
VQAAVEALENARIREKLAEGRYQAGVGSALEVSDAVLALANAGGQRISADLNVGTARSQLLRALGRR